MDVSLKSPKWAGSDNTEWAMRGGLVLTMIRTSLRGSLGWLFSKLDQLLCRRNGVQILF